VSTLPRTSPRLITTKEAAELLHVSSRTVLNWIESGSIPYVELPSSGARHEYRIPVLALMQSLRGNYDLASDIRELDEATTAAGVTDDDLAAALDEG
jgi:excisionase family DNA binding protein